MRLFKSKDEQRTGLWNRVVDFALTDIEVLTKGVDQGALEALEERLLAADFGVKATVRLVDHIEKLARRGKIRGERELRDALRGEVAGILQAGETGLADSTGAGPTVYLLVGVNGVGKTTSIAKLAHLYVQQEKSVLIAAADTYRAGAVQQLEQWASSVGADFVQGNEGGDPAAVAFDSIEAGVARGSDVVLIDTAGRLHTNPGLMDELRKVKRVVARQLAGAPHELLIVLDATIGQNAVSQVSSFHEALGLTGILLAKMDSTARGGIVVALVKEHGVPVKLVGLGESMADLDRFDAEAFLDGVFAGE